MTAAHVAPAQGDGSATASLYRILTADEWQRFQADGLFEGGPLDRADGFIHLSAEDQVDATLAAHFPDRTGLVVVEIATDSLGDALRWEPSRGGALFPHLHAMLPLAAIRSARGLG